MKKSVALFVVSAWTIGLLSSCSKAPDGKSDGAQKGPDSTAAGKTAGQTGGSSTDGKTGAQTGAETGADTGSSAKTAEAPASEPATTGGGDANGSDARPKRAPLPQVEAAQKKVNVEDLPNDMTIVTVAGNPITVGEYRRMFKLQQIQLQNAVTSDPNSRGRVLMESKSRGVTLTPDEQSRLLQAARGGKSADSPEFKSFLKEKNVTVEQFNKEVTDAGLAIKTVNAMLQQTLLNDLVNRELLCAAGNAAGLSTQANNRYFEIKRSAQYKQLLKVTEIPAEQLKDELVKSELTKMMVERIQQRAVVTDRDIQNFYTKNKAKFKHNERIRLSQVIVAAPSQDIGPIKSVRSQLQKANPKLAGKELDATVALTMDALQRRAQEVLIKAKSGESFAELANKYTDDVPAKAGKTGGDIGWRDKGQLPPELEKALWTLKVGDVYPGLVKSELGFQVFKVTGHEGPGPIALADVKELLRGGLKQEKGSQALSGWLRDKRRNVQVVLDPQFGSLVAAEQAKASQASSLSTLTH